MFLRDFVSKYSDHRSEGSWSIAMSCVFLSLIILSFVFYQTITSIVYTWWRSGTFTHGFLVFPIAIYLIWNKRDELAVFTPNTEVRVLLLIGVLLLVWLSAHILNVMVVMQFIVVALIISIAWLLLGTRIVAILMFPLGFMFFAVPFGEFLVPTLQDITATFVVKALQLGGIPVYLEGRYFNIPSGSFEVAKGCSGVRYLIASICLGTLYAYLMLRTLKRRILFIAFCAILPIVANGIRAYGIVMIAHLSDYKLAVGVDHILYGWLFFGLVVFFAFWVGSLFREKDDEFKAKNMDDGTDKSTSNNYIPLTVALIVMMTSSSLLANWIYFVNENIPSIELQFPQGQANWEGPFDVNSRWKPTFHGVSYEKMVRYKTGANWIDTYIGYYSNQRQGVELVSAQNELYDKKWKRISDTSMSLTLENGDVWKVNEVVISYGQHKRILWYWYDIGGHYTTSSIMAKLLELPAYFSKEKKRSAIFIASTNYINDAKDSRRDLREFLKGMLTPLLSAI
jgi:exosortase A